MITIAIQPLARTSIAEDKDQARALRIGRILPALESGDEVTLDFAAVTTATQSYVHALLSEAIRVYGDGAFDLIHFRNCSPDVREVIATVFEYTLLAREEVEQPAKEGAD